MASRHDNPTNTLVEAWSVISRYRWRFIIPAFLATSLVLGMGLVMPRRYEASAIFERRTDMVLNEIVQRGAAQSFESSSPSVIEEITGQPAIDELIEDLAESPLASLIRDSSRSDLQDLRNEIGRKVNVKYDITTKNLDRVRVSYIHENPLLARFVANELVQNYIDRTRKQIDSRLEKAASFFRHEVDRSRGLIEELENRKLTFEIEHAELLPNSPGSLQEVLTNAQLQLLTLQQQCEAGKMKVESLTALVEQTPRTVPKVSRAPNPLRLRIEAQLRELHGQVAEFEGDLMMTGKHPDLISAKEQIAALEKELKETAMEVVVGTQMDSNRKRESLELQLTDAALELKAYQRQRSAMESQITLLNTRSANLFPIRSNYQKLTRSIDGAQRQLTFWEDNLRRVQMALTAESDNRGVSMEFIKPSETVSRPTSPDLAQILVVSVALGLATGAICAFLAYRTDESFVDSDQLAETLELPLFGSVGEIFSQQQKRARRLRALVLYPVNMAAMAAVLILMVTLLYLSLEEPELLNDFRQSPGAFVRDRLADQGREVVDVEMETSDVRATLQF